MARQKIPNVREGEEVQGERDEENQRREEIQRGKRKATEGSGRKKKTKEDPKESARKEWENSMATRKATCERMVDRKHIGETEVVLVIDRRGLRKWFNPVAGYIQPIVKTFFTNMRLPEGEINQFTSTVRGKRILITPMVITFYLGCPAFDESVCTFPREEEVYDPRFYADEMFSNPNEFHGQFPVGSLKEEYRLVNKIIHYNLYPRGVENILGAKEVQLVYSFLHDDVMDLGRYIFRQLVEFRTNTMRRANFPYPAMITQLCLEMGVEERNNDIWTEGLGPISGVTASKSNAHSRNPTTVRAPPSVRTSIPAASRVRAPTATPSVAKPDKNSFKGKMWKMMKKIFCRQSEIKKTQKEILKTQKQILRRQKFTMDHVATQIGRPYISDSEQEEEESETEEEVSSDSEEEPEGDDIVEESE